MDHQGCAIVSCRDDSGRCAVAAATAGVALVGPTADATATAWWCEILGRNPFSARQRPEDTEELLLFPLRVLTILLPLPSVFPHAPEGLPDSLFSVRLPESSRASYTDGGKIHVFESSVVPRLLGGKLWGMREGADRSRNPSTTVRYSLVGLTIRECSESFLIMMQKYRASMEDVTDILYRPADWGPFFLEN